MKIGLIREGKTPPDKRVVLLPEQCLLLQERYPEVQIYVEKSPVRCVPDTDYEKAGLPVVDNISVADLLLGIKEVPIEALIPEKTYMFFSHTIKKQPYNRKLLQTILQKHITLIDFECLTDEDGNRLIAFGRFAGIVGAYNALWTYGKRFGAYELKRAYECKDYEELKQELKKVKLPTNYKIVLTGRGRVGNGAAEVLDAAGIRKVSPQEFVGQTFEKPVYAQLASRDYYAPNEGIYFDEKEFYLYPERFHSDFLKYALTADMLITGHFWNPRSEPLFTVDDMQSPAFKIKIIADITCDIRGSVPSTIRATTIESPVYDFDPFTGKERAPFSNARFVTVMAVDNLPCELPLDASRLFGRQFIENVFPHFMNGDKEGVLTRATIAKDGKLTPRYAYLQDYVEGKS
ncbi:hypothetical protein FHS56_001390 [Thermonema lapsum]|uniref:Alanine dehydrogenase/pyridine nucleotide transhydrogenase N-terminal domain-containing protein n=1 Tax=Thermonema lapsum TaxID=28195 RepID=A0A846MRI8_9BACT|nr:NAD(P)-dependent oxidoreductase [Thermonema lapsum]NIK73877.1 hypothetical protein [Thermonema lapsum]